MGTATIFIVTVLLLQILGFASCTLGNTTFQVRPETGIVTPPTPRKNSSVRPETRIVEGEEAKENEFPHQVYITTKSQNNGQRELTLCGGSIVTENYVLTAAHCLDKMNPDKTMILAGIHNTDERGPFAQSSEAAKIFVHKCFDPESIKDNDIRNDIALIKLSRPFSFEEVVQPIRIDVRNRALVNRPATVIGWGLTSDDDDSSVSRVLKKAELNIISEGRCKRIFQIPFLDYDNQVCASSNFGWACQGDSGGPLLCFENGRRYVCGITSFVSEAGCSAGPSAYTRVSHFKNWIYDVVKNGRDSSKDCVGGGSRSLITSNGFSYGAIILTILFQYLL